MEIKTEQKPWRLSVAQEAELKALFDKANSLGATHCNNDARFVIVAIEKINGWLDEAARKGSEASLVDQMTFYARTPVRMMPGCEFDAEGKVLECRHPDKVKKVRIQVITPWLHDQLEGWRIVGMNHYANHVAGNHNCLFVAMTNSNQQCIKAEGLDTDAVWESLRNQADALKQQQSTDPSSDPNTILHCAGYYVRQFDWDLFVKAPKHARRLVDGRPVLDGPPYAAQTLFDGTVAVRWYTQDDWSLYSEKDFDKLCLVVNK